MAKETTFGVPAAVTSFVPDTSVTMEAEPGLFYPQVMMGVRDLNVFPMYGQRKNTGAVAGPLFPTNGIPLLTASIGTDSTQTGTAATTVKNGTVTGPGAAIATVGTTTLVYTVTNTTPAPVVGDLLQVGPAVGTFGSLATPAPTGAAYVTRVTAVTGTGPYTLTVSPGIPSATAIGAVAQAVQAPFYHNIVQSNTLPSLTIEKNIGGYESLLFAGCKVGKYGLKCQAADSAAEFTADITAKGVVPLTYSGNAITATTLASTISLGTQYSSLTLSSPISCAQGTWLQLITPGNDLNGENIGITGVTVANPGVVTTASSHNLQTGNTVSITGVQGAVQANGTWPVTVLTPTTFSVPTNVTGTYTTSAGAGLTLTGAIGNPTTVITSSAAHNLVSGQAVTITGMTGAGGTASNGTWIVTVLSPTTFSIPVTTTGTGASGSFTTNLAATSAISVVGSSTTTITVTGGFHGLVSGDYVTIAGMTGGTQVNGTWPVTVISASTFSIPVTTTVAGTGGTSAQIGSFSLTANSTAQYVSVSQQVTTSATVPVVGFVANNTYVAGVTTVQNASPSTVSVVNEIPFLFAEANVLVPGWSGAGTNLYQVSNIQLDVDNGLKPTYTMNNTHDIQFLTPVTRHVMGQFDVVFTSLDDPNWGFWSQMINQTGSSFTVTFQHPYSPNYAVQFNVSNIQLQKYSDAVKLQDVVMTTLNFEANYNLNASSPTTIGVVIADGQYSPY